MRFLIGLTTITKTNTAPQLWGTISRKIIMQLHFNQNYQFKVDDILFTGVINKLIFRHGSRKATIMISANGLKIDKDIEIMSPTISIAHVGILEASEQYYISCIPKVIDTTYFKVSKIELMEGLEYVSIYLTLREASREYSAYSQRDIDLLPNGLDIFKVEF